VESYCAARVLLNSYALLPKAHVCTTLEGDTFLKLKMIEQISLIASSWNYVIAPANQSKIFTQELERSGERLKNDYLNIYELQNTPYAPEFMSKRVEYSGWSVLEQGLDLSTIRFLQNGEPFVNSDGSFSAVAAGHGELVNLFSKVVAEHPLAECLHIRNIDNVIGCTEDRAWEMSVPADLFRKIRDAMEFFRAEISNLVDSSPLEKTFVIETEEAYKCLRYFHHLGSKVVETTVLGTTELSRFFANLFHWPEKDLELLMQLPPNCRASWNLLLEILNRPLSVFGVVRKEVGDVGGGPVFAQLPDGSTVKLCMEMPHASDTHIKEYFGSRGKATHFNPVLVFFELQTGTAFQNCRGVQSVDFHKLFDERFWLLTKRDYLGKPVCYHETVLYELLGNSATANLIFVEVPRTLFVPHKTIFDSLSQDRTTYGFQETLRES
jgi:hypothetical protein